MLVENTYRSTALILVILVLMIVSSITTPQSASVKHYWLSLYYSDQPLREPVFLTSVQNGFLVSSRVEAAGERIVLFKIDDSGNVSWSIALDIRGRTLNQLVGLSARYVVVNTIEGYPSRVELQFVSVDGTLLSPVQLSDPRWFNINVKAASTFENRLFLLIAEPITKYLSLVLTDSLGRVLESKKISFKAIESTDLKIDGLCYSRETNTILVSIVTGTKILLVSLDSWNARVKWVRAIDYPSDTRRIQVNGVSCVANSYVILATVSTSSVSKPYVTLVSINGERFTHVVIEGVDNYIPISSVNYMDNLVVTGFTGSSDKGNKLILFSLNKEWRVTGSTAISIINVTRYYGVEAIGDCFLIWGRSVVRGVDGVFLFKIKDILNIPRFEGLNSTVVAVNVNTVELNSSAVEFSEYSFSTTSEVSKPPSASFFTVKTVGVYRYVEAGETISKSTGVEAGESAHDVKIGSLPILLAPILIPLVITVTLLVYVTGKGKGLSPRSS